MHLSFLQPLLARDGPWATAYFDPGEPDESGAKRRELSVRDLCRTLEDEGADPATVAAVRDHLTELSPAEHPAGEAVFATGGEVVLSHRLPRRPTRDLACWAPLPRLTPLLELRAGDPLCLVAYIDRTGADFELREGVGAQGHGGVEGEQWPVHRTTSSDWSERHFQLKVENTWEHNAGEIADALTSAYADSEAELVVLAGDPRERRAVYDRLPEALRTVTSETEHGGRAPGSRSALLDEAVGRARQEYVHRHVEQTLDRFRAGRVGSGRPTDAVEGVPAVADAARQQRIATLLLRSDGPDLHREMWAGADPEQLAVRRTDAEALGSGTAVSVRADDALVRAAVDTSTDVLIVAPEDAADDVPAGGLGALLRWP